MCKRIDSDGAELRLDAERKGTLHAVRSVPATVGVTCDGHADATSAFFPISGLMDNNDPRNLIIGDGTVVQMSCGGARSSVVYTFPAS